MDLKHKKYHGCKKVKNTKNTFIKSILKKDEIVNRIKNDYKFGSNDINGAWNAKIKL